MLIIHNLRFRTTNIPNVSSGPSWWVNRPTVHSVSVTQNSSHHLGYKCVCMYDRCLLGCIMFWTVKAQLIRFVGSTLNILGWKLDYIATKARTCCLDHSETHPLPQPGYPNLLVSPCWSLPFSFPRWPPPPTPLLVSPLLLSPLASPSYSAAGLSSPPLLASPSYSAAGLSSPPLLASPSYSAAGLAPPFPCWPPLPSFSAAGLSSPLLLASPPPPPMASPPLPFRPPVASSVGLTSPLLLASPPHPLLVSPNLAGLPSYSAAGLSFLASDDLSSPPLLTSRHLLCWSLFPLHSSAGLSSPPLAGLPTPSSAGLSSPPLAGPLPAGLS